MEQQNMTGDNGKMSGGNENDYRRKGNFETGFGACL